jgi:hypothetical protein
MPSERGWFPLYSSVRLAFFEKFDDLCMFDRGLELCADEISLLAEGCLTQGKVSLIARLLSCEQNELPRQVIEGGTEVIENLTDKKSPLRELSRNAKDAVEILTRLRIELELETLSTGGQGLLDGRLKLVHLAIRPLDLLSDSGEAARRHLPQGYAATEDDA